MVYRLLKVYTKEEKPTDRDNFRFKRIELSGTLIYDLFREYYLIQKKILQEKLMKNIIIIKVLIKMMIHYLVKKNNH